MWQSASDGLTYLLSQSGESMLRLFWFVAIFEIPRYPLGFVSVAALSFAQYARSSRHQRERVTVLIAGHNEEDSIERCVQVPARAEPAAGRNYCRQRRLDRPDAGEAASIAGAWSDQRRALHAGAVGQVGGGQPGPAARYRRCRHQCRLRLHI